MKYPQRNKLETAPPGPLMQAALGLALTRVRTLSLLKWLARGLLAGLGLAVLFLAIARLWPWPGLLWWCLAAGGVSILLALILAWLYRPGWYSAAVWLDEAGLRERAVTALENSRVDTEISRCQRQDTLKQIRRFRVGDEPFPRPLKQLAWLGGLAVLVLTLTLLPNPRQLEAEREQAVRRAATEQSHKVAAVRKKMEAANKAYPLPEREQTIQSLKELERQLEQARNLNQGLQAVTKAEEQLQKLQNTSAAGADSKSLAQALEQQQLTRTLGQKMAAGDIKGSREETQKLLKRGAAMNKEQREAAAGEMDAQAASLNPTGASVMQALAAGLRKGQAAPANGLLNQVAAATRQNGAASTISQGLTQASDCRQGLLAAGDNSPAGELATGGSSGKVQAVIPGGGSGNGSGQQSGSGNGNGTGQSGNGSGQGQGSAGNGGGSGSGAGTGTGNGSETRGREAWLGGGVKPSGEAQLSIGQYEKIFAPSLINSSGEQSQVRGHAGNGPEESVDTNEPLPEQGRQRPYNEVVGVYSQRAQEALDRGTIPPGMTEIVKGYFSSLEE